MSPTPGPHTNKHTLTPGSCALKPVYYWVNEISGGSRASQCELMRGVTNLLPCPKYNFPESL